MIKKTLEELKNLLSKSTVKEETPTPSKEEEKEEKEEKKKKEVPQEPETEQIKTEEIELTTENKSLSDTVEIVEVNVSKLMESIFVPYFEKIVATFEEFQKMVDSIRQENNEILLNITEAVKEVVEDGSELKGKLEEIEKRLSKLEETPRVKKSVQSDMEVKERFEKSQNGEYQRILTKLTNLAIQGKIDFTDVPKFELAKSLDVLSPATRQLLESN